MAVGGGVDIHERQRQIVLNTLVPGTCPPTMPQNTQFSCRSSSRTEPGLTCVQRLMSGRAQNQNPHLRDDVDQAARGR